MRLLFVGPSHIPRLRHALEVVGLPRPTKEILYFGDGGYPIWNKDAYEECCKVASPDDKILLIVADFRFGNSILTIEDPTKKGDIFQNDHTHIKRDLCSLEADHAMKQRCIEAIAQWKLTFQPNLTVLHWTLAMRTVRNRITGQHVNTRGVYKHPVWNIDEAAFLQDTNELCDVQHTSELSSYETFTIDNDLHPSTLGYLYISSYAVTQSHSLATDYARKIYLAGINAIISSMAAGLQGCIICGNSPAISIIKTTLPASANNFLLQNNIRIVAPRTSPPFIENAPPLIADRIVFIANSLINNRQDMDNAKDRILATFSANQRAKVVILFWDALANRVMQWRARTQRSLKTSNNELSLLSSIFRTFWTAETLDITFDQLDRYVEYGAGGNPTFWGICQILAQTSGINNNGASLSAFRAMQSSATNAWLAQ